MVERHRIYYEDDARDGLRYPGAGRPVVQTKKWLDVTWVFTEQAPFGLLSGFEVVILNGTNPDDPSTYVRAPEIVAADVRRYTVAVAVGTNLTNARAAVRAIYGAAKSAWTLQGVGQVLSTEEVEIGTGDEVTAAASTAAAAQARVNLGMNAKGRLHTQKFMPMVQSEMASVSNGSVLSASDNGSSATITVAAHVAQFGGFTVSYSSATISGLNYSKKYYVYCDDEDFVGGAVTYVATTSISTAKGNVNRRMLGSITTPSSGGGSVTQPDPDDCVAAGMWLLPELQVDDAAAGDLIDVWDIGDIDVSKGAIEAIRPAPYVQCVRLVMESGAQVVCSISTPVTGPDGEVRRAPDAMDMQLGVLHKDRPMVWERVVAVTPAGLRTVYHLSCGNISFAAGVDPEHRVVTHNIYYKP